MMLTLNSFILFADTGERILFEYDGKDCSFCRRVRCGGQVSHIYISLPTEAMVGFVIHTTWEIRVGLEAHPHTPNREEEELAESSSPHSQFNTYRVL